MIGALARRTRVACSGIVHGVGVPALLAISPANQRTEGGIWPRGPMKPPIGHNSPPTDGWVLSARQIKRVGMLDKEALTTSDGRLRLTASNG